MNFTRTEVLDMTLDEAYWHFNWLKEQRAEEARQIREAQQRQRRR